MKIPLTPPPHAPGTSPLVLCDTRELPWSEHPWARYWQGVRVERNTLQTGDFALKGFEDVWVVERKAPSDFLACVGGERERFEKELARSRYCGRFLVVVEGSFQNVIKQARGIHENAILGTVTAWIRRYCPVLFCDTPELAAGVALRWLLQPIQEARRNVKTAASFDALPSALPAKAAHRGGSGESGPFECTPRC